MDKKIIILLICLLFTSACNKQNNQEITVKSLCDQIKNDINNYQNNNITKEEIYSKLENYNDTCYDSFTNICINIKALMTVPIDRKELQKEYLINILDNCQS